MQMAVITTAQGVQINISPDHIVEATDDLQAGICDVYGATPAPLRVNETATALLARLAITGKFAQLTRPDGTPVWINGKTVGSVRAPLVGEYPATAHAVVGAGAVTQAVQEDVSTTVAALNARGASL
jgi:hypothetical protein